MQRIGYVLLDKDNKILEEHTNFPDRIILSNGDIVHGASVGEVFNDGSKILDYYKEVPESYPGDWYDLIEEKQIKNDKVVLKVFYSTDRNINRMRRELTVSPFQAKVALLQQGLLDTVETLITANTTDPVVKLAWTSATEFTRLSPTIISLSQSLNLTDEQLDELFLIAYEIRA